MFYESNSFLRTTSVVGSCGERELLLSCYIPRSMPIRLRPGGNGCAVAASANPKLPARPMEPTSSAAACKVRHHMCIVLAFIVVRAIGTTAAGADTDIQARERAALRALYIATGGDQWSSTSTSIYSATAFAQSKWNVPDPLSDYCSWYGVSCSWNGGPSPPVLMLGLSSLGLRGTLPIGVFQNLSALTALSLTNNQLHGGIPSDLANCINMRSFDVSNNSLTGTLPPELSRWTSIETFSITRNRVNGTLPPEYSAWKNIWYAYFDSNPLLGTLPSSYGTSWQSIRFLFVANTNISGTIPSSWGQMTRLTSLQLHLNSLSGTLLPDFGNLSYLFSMNFAANNFSGTIPSHAWSRLRFVQSILVQDNPHLYGTVPASWTNIFNGTATVINGVLSLPILSICRTHVCGPPLPSLTFGYGCLAKPLFPRLQLGNITSEFMLELFQSTTWSQEFLCNATSTSTFTLTPQTPNEAMTGAATATQYSTSAAGVTVAITVVQQFIPGLASAAGIRTMQATLALQRLRQQCSALLRSAVEIEQADVCCDWATSPTQLQVALGEAHEQVIGAVLGNTLVVAILAGLRAAGSFVVAHLLAWSDTRHHRSAYRFVKVTVTPLLKALFLDAWGLALLWPTFVLLLCPTVAVCTAVIATARGSGGIVVFGVLAAALWTAPWAAAAWRILIKHSPQPSVARQAHRRRRGRRVASLWQRLRKYFISPREPVVFSPQAAEYVRSYGTVFSAYCASRMWYFNVELLFSASNGVLAGVAMSLEDPCSGAATVVGWLLVATAVLECGAAVVLRPYSARIDLVSLLAVNGLSVASQVLSILGDGDAAQSASAALGLAASLLQLLVTLLLGWDIVVVVTTDPSVAKHDDDDDDDDDDDGATRCRCVAVECTVARISKRAASRHPRRAKRTTLAPLSAALRTTPVRDKSLQLSEVFQRNDNLVELLTLICGSSTH